MTVITLLRVLISPGRGDDITLFSQSALISQLNLFFEEIENLNHLS